MILLLMYRMPVKSMRCLKDKSRVDEIIVKKQPYQLLNTSCEFILSFDASNLHKLANEFS